MTETVIRKLLDAPRRTLILTPNSAVARRLRREALMEASQRVMQTPSIIPLDHWLHTLTDELLRRRLAEHGETPRIATTDQEQLLWAQTLEADQDVHAPVTTAAEEASRVFRLLRERRLDTADLPAVDQAFRAWINNFREQLSTHGLTTSLDFLIANEREAIQIVESQFEAAFAVGFSTGLPPAAAHLLQASSIAFAEHELPKSEQSGVRVELPSPRLELRRAIAWARNVYRADTAARIAIVAPRLERVRTIIEHELLTAFGDPAIFSIVPPKPLAQQRLVRTALDLLDLNREELSAEQCSRLLNMSGWAPGTDAALPGWRTEADTRLKSIAVLRLHSDRFRELVIESIARLASDRDCPAPPPGLTAARELMRSATRGRHDLAPSEWARLFEKQLEEFGWPPTNTPAHEFEETVTRWLDALRRLSHLDAIKPTCSLVEALGFLGSICESIPGTSPSTTAAVLVTESVESTADRSHVWLAGAHHLEWPQPPRPSPMLSIGFQRQHRFPRVSAEHELEMARRLLDQLRCSGAEVIFSYAARDGDQQQMISPLLAELPEVDATQLGNSHEPESAPTSMEQIDCSRAPPLTADERKETRGGSGLLQTFAACPFTAFAAYRLRIEPFPEPSLGFSVRDRGSLTHRALEIVSNRISSRSALDSLSPGQRREICRKASQDAVHRYSARMFNPPPVVVTQLEIERLCGLLERWLEAEAKRPPFEIVGVEAEIPLQLGPLQLKLRVDRIDQCETALLLIDYKTGSQLKTRLWLSDPPAEPQLPLYCIATGSDVDGIAFGQVNAATQRLLGLQRSGVDMAPGLTELEDWAEWLEIWRDSLTRLAQRYADGDCVVGDHSVTNRHGDEYAAAHRWAELQSTGNAETQA